MTDRVLRDFFALSNIIDMILYELHMNYTCCGHLRRTDLTPVTLKSMQKCNVIEKSSSRNSLLMPLALIFLLSNAITFRLLKCDVNVF